MKTLSFVLLSIVLSAGVWAQNRKVEMALQLPLDEVLAKAKAQNKYVFLDFGSPRCSPCLWIKKNIFTIDSVADFINSTFVSVDYQLGDEKKRLSKMYGVVGEPVLLILDQKGTLMHKMVGKCSPNELVARFKQGLDVKNNLVAQNAQYAGGEKSSAFLLKYLETLYVAREVEQMSSVLKEFFNVPVEKLKEKGYWEVFKRYNEEVMSREMIYVFDNRKVFYDLYGKDIVDGKINNLFSAKSSYYIFGHTAPLKDPVFVKMLDYVERTDYEKAKDWLVYLRPAKYKFTDWVAMGKEIDKVIASNQLEGARRESYMKMMSEQMYWYSEDKNALPYSIKWIDKLLPSVTDNDTRKSLLQTKLGVMEKLDIKEGLQNVKNEISKLEVPKQT